MEEAFDFFSRIVKLRTFDLIVLSLNIDLAQLVWLKTIRHIILKSCVHLTCI